jgi:hypothetical protein
MSSCEFSIDPTRFYRPQTEVLPDTPESIFAKKERLRFLYLDNAERCLKEQASGKRWEKLLDLISKIVAVYGAIVTTLISLAMGYFPVWIPICFGLLHHVGLTVLQVKLQQEVENRRRDNEFAPLFKELLEQRSLKALHPIGEWDLAEIDNRLKSDLMMKEKLHKRHPQSSNDIEEILGCKSREEPKQQFAGRGLPEDVKPKPTLSDLEVPEEVKKYIAFRYANPDQVKRDKIAWDAVKEAISKAKACLSKGDVQGWGEMRLRAFNIAYGRLESCDFALPTAKEYVESIVMLYHSFCKLYPEAEKLLKEGEELYAPCTFLDEKERILAGWEEYLKYARQIKDQINPLVELLEKNAPPAQEEEFLLALKGIHENQLNLSLFYLIDQTRQIQADIKTWIELHPKKRLAACLHILEEWNKKMLTERELNTLNTWIIQNPKVCEKKCIEFKENSDFPKEILSWLEAFPDMYQETPKYLLNKAKLIRERVDATLQGEDWAKLCADVALIEGSAEHYKIYIQDLNNFKEKMLKPLDELIDKFGEISTLKHILHQIVRAKLTKHPAAPFAKIKVPREEGPLQISAIEEKRLNIMLKQIDAKMLRTNFFWSIALFSPLHILFVVNSICAIYFSIPWLLFGFSVLNVVVNGISYYVNDYLRKIDRQKQAVKLQQILRNHPDIGRIPGTRPKLKKLKELQQHLGLEGVRPTWARALAEGEEVLPNPSNPASAKKAFKKLAEEGSQKSKGYLENRLIGLKAAAKAENNPQSQKGINLDKSVRQIKAALEYKPQKKEYPTHEPQEYEKRVIKLRAAEAELDRVVEERLKQEKQLVVYKEILQKLEYSQRVIALFTLLKQALEGEQERDSQESIDPIVKKTLKILRAIQKEMDKEMKEEKSKELSPQLECLKRLPREVLEKRIQEIEEQHLPRAQRVLGQLQAYRDYASIESINAEMSKINAELDKLKVEFNEKRSIVQKLEVDVKACSVNIQTNAEKIYEIDAAIEKNLKKIAKLNREKKGTTQEVMEETEKLIAENKEMWQRREAYRQEGNKNTVETALM